jgi:protein involved in polysaccharide export with SLBB domain
MRPHQLFRLVLASLSLSLTSCQSPQTDSALPAPRLPNQALTTTNSQNFQVGDQLELIVEEDPTFNENYEVRDGGYILIPKVGRVPILGLSRGDAENQVKQALQKQQLTKATVFVERRAKNAAQQSAQNDTRISVFITGSVIRPGQHYIPLPTDGRPPGLYETILVTGGMAKFADDSKAKLMRADSQGVRRTMVVNLKSIQSGLTPDVPIGEGDIINVPEKVFGF